MADKQFLESEAAALLAEYAARYNGNINHPWLPAWITEEDRAKFRACSADEITAIRMSDFFSRNGWRFADVLEFDPAQEQPASETPHE